MPLRVEPNIEAIPGYRLLERIGGGGFGEVWKAEAPGGLMKAIKIIHGDLRSIDKNGSRHAEQELRALKRLQAIRHPYLLSLERYDIIEGKLLIVTELADCNLWDRFRECRTQNLPGIPRVELLRLLEEASEVLDLMNNQYQLQHLDIKPQNLFLVHSHVKVADFGLVKDLEGVQGVITGGVTPVYGAPETFENKLTRYCDQYSLAIVYQELLTGVRPFNGTSGQQLLMQHIRESPNLASLPPADRPAVARALSKKPEDRFPSCLDFVRELCGNGGHGPMTIPLHTSHSMSSSRMDTPSAPRNTPNGADSDSGMGGGSGSGSGVRRQTPVFNTPQTEIQIRRPESGSSVTIGPGSSIETAIPHKIAPPEQTGEGLLVPAIVIGLGGTGMQILREFRRSCEELVIKLDRVPNIRTLLADTDSDTLHKATAEGPGSLNAADVLPMKLNRPAHYLKPRRNGRTLVDGWFDPQTLYKIPRNPETLGIRSLGRLAFLDHYRQFGERLTTDIESITLADTLGKADRLTKLGLRSNRPRVYIVCNLAGGTGGGMFLDAAYAARHKLRQQGYLEPEIIGLFIVPAAERGVKSAPLANTYGALRELNHYSQNDTVFNAHYEERDGRVSDPSPPFSRCVVIPLPGAARNGANSEAFFEAVIRRAGSLLARDLLTPLGPSADEIRWHRPEFGVVDLNLSVVGQCSFVWPRHLLLTRAARWLSAAVLSRWIDSDPQVIGQYVQNWLEQRWVTEGLSPENLVAQVQAAGERALGQSAENYFASEAQPFASRGRWFRSEPDPALMNQGLQRLIQLVGMPDDRSVQRSVGSMESQLHDAADRIAAEYLPKLMRLATTLLEHTDYRFVGAEQVVRQMIGRIDGILNQYEPHANNLNRQAIDAYFRVLGHVSGDRFQQRHQTQEVSEAFRNYPTWRHQALVLRQVIRIFSIARTQLEDQLREFELCRARLADTMEGLRRPRPDYVPPTDRLLLPPGVPSIEAALESLHQSLKVEDIRQFDKSLQSSIEKEFSTLLKVCQSSSSLLANLRDLIEERAIEFFAPRLVASSVSQMFFARFPTMESANEAINWLFEQAGPPVNLPLTERVETVLMAGPTDASGQQFTKFAKNSLPSPLGDYVASRDEILIYREYSRLPLTALPQLGVFGEDAYNAALDGIAPHSRFDERSWRDVEPV